MRFLLWVFRCAPLSLGIPLLSCVTKPYSRAFASVSCSVFRYNSGHGCPPYAQHGSWWPDITPAPAHASLSPAFSFQPVQTLSQRKPSWRWREETSPFGTRLLPNWLVPQTLTTHVLGLGEGHTDAGEAEATGQV